jgi:GntR family transcriptional regulator
VEVRRVILLEDRPVAYLVDILPDAVLAEEELRDEFSGSVLDVLLTRGNPPLGSSRCDILAEAASSEVARPLGIQRGDVLLKFVSVLLTESGEPIDFSQSYFLPGYFRFHVVRRVG